MSAERSSADGPDDHLRAAYGGDARQLGIVAVEADDDADATEVGVDDADLVARGHPAAPGQHLGAERVCLAIATRDRSVAADQRRGVVDDAPLGAALVAAGNDVDAQARGDRLQRLQDRSWDHRDQVPEVLRGDAGREAGGHRLGQHDELGARGVDATLDPLHRLGEVALHRLGGERSLHRRDLHGRNGERLHVGHSSPGSG